MSNAPEGQRLFVGLDIETTGIDIRMHSILEIGAIVFDEEDLPIIRKDPASAAELRALAYEGEFFEGVARVPELLELDEKIVKMHTGNGLLEACAGPEAYSADVELCAAFQEWLAGVQQKHPLHTIVFFGRNVGSFDRAFIEEVLQNKLEAYHRALDLSAFWEVFDLLEGRKARKESGIEKVEIEGLRDHRSIDDVLRDLVILSRVYDRVSVTIEE